MVKVRPGWWWGLVVGWGMMTAGGAAGAAVSLKTADGLQLTLSHDGQPIQLAWGSQTLALGPGGGLVVVDRGQADEVDDETTAPTPQRYRLRAPLVSEKGVWVQRGELAEAGVKAELAMAPAGEYLSLVMRVEDTTGRDRALEVSWELPLPAAGFSWHDDLQGGRPVPAEGICRQVIPASVGPGYQQLWPLVSLTRGGQGLALGVTPVQGPRVTSLEYDAEAGVLAGRGYLGLSQQAVKLKGRGSLSLLLFRHDGAWGLRAALARYYQFYAPTFVLPADSASAPEADSNTRSHLYPVLSPADERGRGGVTEPGWRELWQYSPGCATLDLDTDSDGQPPPESLLRLLKELMACQGDDLPYGRQQADFPLSGQTRQVQWHEPAWSLLARYAASGAEAPPQLAPQTRPLPPTASGQPRWRLAIQVCDDPELSAAVTEHLHQTLAGWQREVPTAVPDRWWVSLLSTATATDAADGRPEHLAVADIPLTYDATSGQPVLADRSWEWESQVLQPLAQQYKFGRLRHCAGAAGLPVAQWGHFTALTGGPPGADDLYLRAAAYRRPVGYSLGQSETLTAAQQWRESLDQGLRYAIYPPPPPPAASGHYLYQRVRPIIEALAAAGWEPVTRARSPQPALQIERFGRLAEGNLALTLFNSGDQPLRTAVILEREPGLPEQPGEVVARDLLRGAGVHLQSALGGQLALPVELAAGEVTVCTLATRPRQLSADLIAAARCLRAAAPLHLATEASVEVSRPGQLLVAELPAPEGQLEQVLLAGIHSRQGLAWAAGEPLQLRLDLNSPHRLHEVRVAYGIGPDLATPPLVLEGADRAGNYRQLATLPAPTIIGPGRALARLVLSADDEYQLLRLRTAPLTAGLVLWGLEIEGREGAMVRAAERFETLARQAGPGDAGVVSQLAIALRVRRMLGHHRARQEQALGHLADFCTLASGLSVTLQLPGEPVSGVPVAAVLAIHNRGPLPVREVSVKLKLSPGWRAAPSKAELPQLNPGESRHLPMTLYAPPGPDRLIMLTTGVVGGQSLFMSRNLDLDGIAAVTAQVPPVVLNDSRQGEATVQLRSQAPEALLITVQWSLPPGWTAPPPQQVRVDSDSVSVIKAPLSAPADLPGGTSSVDLLLDYGDITETVAVSVLQAGP